MAQEHDEYLSFYRKFISPREDADHFVIACESSRLNGSERPLRHPARLIMHQCYRLVTVAQEVHRFRPDDHSLQVLLLLTCAESAEKLRTNRLGTRGITKDVIKSFFLSLPAIEQQELISGCTDRIEESPVTLPEIVDGFYAVRNEAAHEGDFHSIWFAQERIATSSRGLSFDLRISLDDFTRIIVGGCINAARERLSENATG